MNIIRNKALLTQKLQQWQKQGSSTALVPIMEPFHRGHINLIAKAKQHAHKVIVCMCAPKSVMENVLLNSLQQENEKLLSMTLADLIYEPEVDMDPLHQVPYLSQILNSVRHSFSIKHTATTTCLMLNEMRPTIVCLSEKDFQQMMIIKHMVANLSMPIHIVSIPTERESDGLAISAYNYLVPQELRTNATQLKNTLDWMASKIIHGKDIRQVRAQGKLQLRAWGFQPSYVDILEPNALTPATNQSEHLGIFASAFLGKPLLNDHLIFQR